MKKKVEEIKEKNWGRKVLWVILGVFFFLFVVLPVMSLVFDGRQAGNAALIPIKGVITADGGSYLGKETIAAGTIIDFLKEAEEREKIKAVVLEINSPGGSAVASDEIATMVKKMKKPVVAVIGETGASGGYWVASAADYVVANRMSITGSIGVLSSYLEFSGLMEKYGVNYERLVAGEYKDMGTPFKGLTEKEKMILQSKIDKIQDFFIKEIAENRGLAEEEVKKMATGEFFLGVEALERGLVDELGDKETAEGYLKKKLGLEKVEYVKYEKEKGLLETLMGVMGDYSFRVGEGIGVGLVGAGGERTAWV